ncbi:vitamin K-dependent protein C [Protopterus annectens]|uniref:vitamin K-dependent protein C n=1 Tax=Protopterus annectens TaxID=7888 RepID=UPI001CFA2A39|nr:vitamin K-dependent protein C [Protopterus annectens]
MKGIHFLFMISSPLWIAGEAWCSVFKTQEEAHQLLKIRKRANSLFEELKAPSLERECMEELCDFEEAREIFRTTPATLHFWTKYFDGDQCDPHPCFNGSCIDQIGRYDCVCHENYEGKHCDYEVFSKNCSYYNGGCQQLCEKTEKEKRICKCLPGYKLQEDYRTCKPQNKYPCGKLQNEGEVIRVVGGEMRKKGDSPWQVMLYDDKRFICGAVLIHHNWVLTAAHCLKELGSFRVKLGKYQRKITEKSELIIPVTRQIIHPNYTQVNNDNDIALLHLEKSSNFSTFIIPVCLPNKGLSERELMNPGKIMTVSGWGYLSEDSKSRSDILMYIDIPLANHTLCSEVMSNTVTENMICAGEPGVIKDACKGDSGGPMVTKYKNTTFLVGLVSWGEGCGQVDRYGVYTRVSNYLHWIRQVILPDKV